MYTHNTISQSEPLPKCFACTRLTIKLASTVVLLFSTLCFSAENQDSDTEHQPSYELGEKRAFTCSECHGERGISFLGIYPNLAGQKYEYLVSALNAYQKGLRQNAIMQDMVMNLTDQDIKNLALYYSEQGCVE